MTDKHQQLATLRGKRQSRRVQALVQRTLDEIADDMGRKWADDLYVRLCLYEHDRLYRQHWRAVADLEWIKVAV